MKKIYIIIHELDYIDDGYSIIGVFETLELAHKAIESFYPKYKKVDDYEYKKEGTGKFSENEYFYINEEEFNYIKKKVYE